MELTYSLLNQVWLVYHNLHCSVCRKSLFMHSTNVISPHYQTKASCLWRQHWVKASHHDSQILTLLWNLINVLDLCWCGEVKTVVVVRTNYANVPWHQHSPSKDYKCITQKRCPETFCRSKYTPAWKLSSLMYILCRLLNYQHS